MGLELPEPSTKPYVSAIEKDVEVVTMKRDEGQGKANRYDY